MAFEDTLNVWVRRSCGHYNVVELPLMDDLEVPPSMMAREEIAFCPPCYSTWMDGGEVAIAPNMKVIGQRRITVHAECVARFAAAVAASMREGTRRAIWPDEPPGVPPPDPCKTCREQFVSVSAPALLRYVGAA